jgi:hypothetical protein
VFGSFRIPARAIGGMFAVLVVLGLYDAPSSAQHASELTEFQAGDLNVRTHIYFEFSSETALQALLAPGDGLRGETFRWKPDGSPSWGKMLHQRGYNVYMLDNVGVGKAPPTRSDDFPFLANQGLEGLRVVGAATIPDLVIAHGEAAGFALKARSMEPRAGEALVLIDPIGPQGSQPMVSMSPAQEYARWIDRKNHIWRRWGFGPKYGTLRRGIDVTEEIARTVVDSYEDDQPAYWVALLTPMDVPLQVREGDLLENLPVLVIRTHGADREQIERENAVVAWMQGFGMRVDRLDLTRDPDLKNTSGLPWIGDLSDAVFARIVQWRDTVRADPATGR